MIVQYLSKQIQAGKIARALKICQKYLPAPFENHFYQGICYFEMGDETQTLFHLKLAWDLQKNSAIAQILAEVYIGQECWDEALTVLKDFSTNFEVKKKIKIIQGNNQARQDYRMCLKLFREGMQCIQRREYNESIRCLKDALPYSEDQGKIYNQIGGIYYNFLKDRSQAKEYFRKAYENSPGNQVFKLNYAKAKLH